MVWGGFTWCRSRDAGSLWRVPAFCRSHAKFVKDKTSTEPQIPATLHFPPSVWFLLHFVLFKTAGVQFYICIQNPRHKTAFLCVKITASEIWSCGGISVSISGRIKRPLKSGSLVQVSREPPLPAGVCILHLTWILTCTATSLNIQLYKCKMRWGWLPFRDFSFREAPESVPVMWGVQLRSVQRAQPGFCLSSLPESSVWNSRAFLIPFPASRGCRQPTLYV